MPKSKNKRNKKYIRPKGANEGLESQGQGDDTLVDIVEVTEQASDFFERNQKTIIGGLAVVVLLLGAYFAYQYGVAEPKNKAAMESIQRAQYQFSRDSFALALENPGLEAEGFLDIIDNYGGTKVANLANYYAGISYLNLGSYEEAIDYLSDFSPADDITPAMKFGAMGDAYSELNQFDKALSNYKKATQTNPNKLTTPYYLFKLGLLEFKQGDKGAALAAFNKIKSDFPESTQADGIDKYIKMAS